MYINYEKPNTLGYKLSSPRALLSPPTMPGMPDADPQAPTMLPHAQHPPPWVATSTVLSILPKVVAMSQPAWGRPESEGSSCRGVKTAGYGLQALGFVLSQTTLYKKTS